MDNEVLAVALIRFGINIEIISKFIGLDYKNTLKIYQKVIEEENAIYEKAKNFNNEKAGGI